MINYIQLEKVEIQNLADNVIDKNIDPSVRKEIEKKDKNPLFEIFRIAHTGISKTTFIGIGTRILTWFSRAVKAIHERIKVRTKVFSGHVQNTNSHKDRDQIGEIVGKFLESIGGKVDSYGIIYRYPEYRDREFDIASYEGNIGELRIDREGNIIVSDQNPGEITGLILDQSEKSAPAFERAVKEGSLQYAVQNLVEKGEKMLTKKEIADAIKEQGFSIEDFWKKEEILENTIVKEAMANDEGKQNLYNQNKRLEVDLHKAKADLNLEKERNEELQGKVDEKNSEILKLNSKEKIETEISDRKLTPNRLKWVNRKMKDFNPSGEKHKLDKDINAAIDAALSEYEDGVKEGIFNDDKKPKEEPKADDTPKEEPKKKEKGTITKPYTREDGLSGVLEIPEDAMKGFDKIRGLKPEKPKEENPGN
jgi:hypothetical protein